MPFSDFGTPAWREWLSAWTARTPQATTDSGALRVPSSEPFSPCNTPARIGLATQVNTTVTRHNLNRIDQIAEMVRSAGACLWSVFFLVATGRASASQDLAAEEYEQVFGFLYDLSKSAPFDIKTTEAQHYRRYVAQRQKAEGGAASRSPGARDVIQRQAGINDGKGLLFISHTGEIYPERLPSRLGGQCPPEFAHRYLPQLRPISKTAPPRQPPWKMRRVRVPQSLRRLALTVIRTDWRLPGRGSQMRISTELHRPHRSTSRLKSTSTRPVICLCGLRPSGQLRALCSGLLSVNSEPIL